VTGTVRLFLAFVEHLRGNTLGKTPKSASDLVGARGLEPPTSAV
jgi:hypothetical protein